MTTNAKPSRIARSACATSTATSASENSSNTLGNIPAKLAPSRLKMTLGHANKNSSSAMSNSLRILSTRSTFSTTTSTLSGPSENLALTTETQTTALPTAVSQSSTCAAEATIDPSKLKKYDEIRKILTKKSEKFQTNQPTNF